MPFGAVKLGIDTHDIPANESANNGGYTPQGNVTGISMTHESGMRHGTNTLLVRTAIHCECRNRRWTEVWLPRSDASYHDIHSGQHLEQSDVLATTRKSIQGWTHWRPLKRLQVGNDTATVGYYRTSLQSGVSVELSATRHAGILQYSFPAGEQHVLVDLSHVSPRSFRKANAHFLSIFHTPLEVTIHSSTWAVR